MSWDKPRIAFFQKGEVIAAQKEYVVKKIRSTVPDAQVEFFSGPDSLLERTQFDIVITPTLPWLDEALSKTIGVRWIHFLSAGVEKIWDMRFDKTSVLMSKSSGVHINTISEFVLGAILFFEKQFNTFVAQSRTHVWQRTWLGELAEKKLVILGAGAIGQKIAERAKVFDMKVVGAVNTLRKIEILDKVVSMEDVADELVDSDYLVCCLPLTTQTKQLVDEAFLSGLKPDAVLIDVSRGGVVSGEAVLRALDKGILRGAALDVFEEQPLSQNSPLWGRDDVLITPHVSGTTQNYMRRALDIFLKNYEQLRTSGSLVTPVSVELGY